MKVAPCFFWDNTVDPLFNELSLPRKASVLTTLGLS